MIRNFFTIAIRSLNKYRFYSLINLLGLTIGITACLVIFLYVRNEISYDRHNENADRIVRIDWDLHFGQTVTYNAAVTPPMAEVFARDYPEVEAAARMRFMGSFQFKKNDENLVVTRVVFADNDLFRIFTIPFKEGDPTNALVNPHNLVISESCAKRFFPDESALGKTLVKDNSTLYTISGVFYDMPQNSHFRYDIFLSMEGLDESKNGNWIGGPFNTYLLLQPGTDPLAFERKLPNVVNQHLMPYAASVLGDNFIDNFQTNPENHLTLRVRPLTDIHLYSHLRNELEANGDIKYVYIFGIIAVFILVIACINFMNLATARSIKRAREVGIRKVMGSNRISLTLQFLAESTLLSMAAFILSLALTEVALPYFNSLTGVELTVPYGNPLMVVSFMLASVLVGIAAGVYPGFVLSSYKPAKVLKGKELRDDSSAFLRSGLVVFQFAISIFLTIATFAIYSQMQYMRKVQVGFNKEQVIRMRDVMNAGDRVYAFRDAILSNPKIKSVTISSFFPGPGSARRTPLVWRYGAEPMPDNSVNMETWSADENYIPTLGMEIVQGRNFSLDYPSDSSAVIINEAALARLDIDGSPLGEKISLFRDNPDGSQNRNQVDNFTIVGVVKDFNFESLRQGVTPLGLFYGRSTGSIAIRYDAANTDEVIEVLHNNWKKIAPGEPFSYGFLDEDFHRMFTTEKKLGQIFVLFSGLAIVIECLGLFALTAFTAEQRTKEIGIRKVMGASVEQVVLLLSFAFGRLVLISFVVAAPLAAIAIKWFLQQYAYRTDIGWTTYLIAGVLAFLLAGLTMGYQSIKAARANPVESLKHE